MQVLVKKLHPDAVAPQYAKPGDACFDLTAAEDGHPHPKDPHAWVYPTGLAFEIPPGHGMLIFSRSGHGIKEAMRLSNCVGVIDSGFRGQVVVGLRADGEQPARQYAGSRIAQACILPIPHIEFVLADELSETERGDGGLGSTGTGALS